MSDSEDSSKKPSTTGLGALAALVNNPLVEGELQQTEHIPIGLSTSYNNDDSNNEDSDRKTNELINELQSESIIPDDDNILPRSSNASGRLITDQDSSTPNITDSSSDHVNQGPARSMSESVLIDHHNPAEQPSTLPVQQYENSTDEDDTSDLSSGQKGAKNANTVNNLSQQEQENNTNRTFDRDSVRSIKESNDDGERSSSATKNNHLDETTRFIAASPKPSVSRIPSTSSKRSQSMVIQQSKSPVTDEKASSSSRITSPQTTKNDTDILTANQSSPSNNHEDEPPTMASTSSSRRESVNKTDLQQTSRPSSAMKSNVNDNKSESSTTQLNNDFATTNEQSKLIKSGEQLQIPTNETDNAHVNSLPPTSENNRKSSTESSVSNKKMIDGDAASSKSRRSSNASQQQKLNLSSSRKGSNASEQKVSNNRESITSEKKSIIQQNSSDDQEKKSSSKSSSRKPSLVEQQRNASRRESQQQLSSSRRTSTSKQEQIISTDNKGSRRVSTDVDVPVRTSAKQINSSTVTTSSENNQTSQATKQIHIPPLQLTDDDASSSRPQSPNVVQLAEHNPIAPKTRKQNTNEQKKKEQHRSNSADSLNYIPLVDDASIDSASDVNTGSGRKQPQRIKSKKINVETNTDQRADFQADTRHISKKQQELTSQKPSKGTKPSSDQHQPKIRRTTTTTERTSTTTTPDTDRDTNTRRVQRSNKETNNNNDPVNVNVTVLVKNIDDEDSNRTSLVSTKQKPQKNQEALQSSANVERHTQSDTEQIITEKQRKRRRPKRVSRKTQTQECIFRRMEREQHDELRPVNDTDKNIQTRKSQLCPKSKSPKKHPTYISTDAFKIEEILPKQFPHSQQNPSKTSMVARSNSPQNGKLLILRPTLPFHHTDAVNVQRICLQYAIDLIPSENKLNDSPYAQRHKPLTVKQPEQTNSLPMIRSSSSLTGNTSINKSNTKDKTVSGRVDDRTYQRKNGGAV
ncbi:unnamed protein product [Rotaria magnacalcarata]|uniref:Uncharacterized protein n=2 Tax=Rotaria magnacalcarata TaxID=392030 RepID=A0A816NTE1_9BILA|nr:unnamed protein product [Rotaria magnacalcarata]CAF2103049.1 unnamed protein product [Rotaria magnacalcarata]CAF3762940.1 unnamed protein product [Rotaria magnacalcarata]CAF3893483.1 unnamed protein product [Rotaria magnacalcarata]